VSDDSPDQSPLEKVDEKRRSYLRKLAAGVAFVVPMVASFSTSGIKMNTAEAHFGGNQSDDCDDEDEYFHHHRL
jgi:hypothetical protein